VCLLPGHKRSVVIMNLFSVSPSFTPLLIKVLCAKFSSKEMWCERIYWIHLADDTVTSFRFAARQGICWITYRILAFQRHSGLYST